jgi:molecular chaperone HscB
MTMTAPNPDRLDALHFDTSAEAGIRPLGTGEAPSHFALFGMEPRLMIDTEALRGAFLDLSRRFHPDFHGGASPALREEVLRRSSLLNNAYKTLRELPKRAEYLLGLLAPTLESNKNAVPPELLEEMFEIQEAGEALREARLAADGAALARAEAAVAPLRAQVNGQRQALEAELEQLAAALDALLDAGEALESDPVQATLRKIRLTLDRLNYLRTVIRNLR